MLQQYTILRDLSAVRLSAPFDVPLAPVGSTESAVEVLPGLASEELRPSDIADLARDPQVNAMAPVMPTQLIAPVEANDANDADTAWGITEIGADQSAYTGKNILVSILDTGIDNAHPAFSGVNLIEKDFTGDGNGDVQGHGTHCAGTVFGQDINGKRIGVAPGVKKALIGKVLGDDGLGDSQMLFEGMQWAAGQDVDVISMSLGFDFVGWVASMVNDENLPVDFATSRALEGYRANLRMFDAIMLMIKRQAAFGTGAVVVAAAGNESKRNVHADYKIGVSIPAAAEGLIAVGALQQGANGLGIAWFSNTFPQIVAPGVNILSAKAGGGIKTMSGTSMACPHVAGLAALWWEAIRSQPLPVKSSIVMARILASATTNGIASDVDVADYGVGLAKAP